MSDFTFSGVVIHKESGMGIPNLLVELLDMDPPNDPEFSAVNRPNGDLSGRILDAVAPADDIWDRLGSAVTNANGAFTINFNVADMNLHGETEKKPDIMLRVLAPDEPHFTETDRILHFSEYVRRNAAGTETDIVRLSTSLLTEHGIPVPTVGTAQATTAKVADYVNLREREKQFNKGVAEYHKTQANAEIEERKTFRKDLIKLLAADTKVISASGVLAEEGDNIFDKTTTTLTKGIEKANEVLTPTGPEKGVKLNLYLTQPERDDLFKQAVAGQIDIEIEESRIRDILFRPNSSENPGTLLIHNNPIANFCAAESFDVKCAKEHTGISNGHQEEPDPSGDPTPTTEQPLTDEDVLAHLNRLVKDMPTPDVVLNPALARADRAEVEKSVSEFALQKGPAEVPAFYDISFLQVAFEHVWKQLFDENIPQLAYQIESQAKTKLGLNGSESALTPFMTSGAFGISGGGLPAATFQSVGSPEVSPIIAKYFDITAEEMIDMTLAMRQELWSLANKIDSNPATTSADVRKVQALMEQGERLIDSVKHDNYYTLHRTLRELEERLNGKYEFTVFAADKDYHSVNFGLVTTYRQQLTPLMYQAGRLVETIPLSPKEERKYSVKNTRTEKRSTKEARKNNSSITSEQHSTSRVEAEIIAKVQQKTTFSLNASGDYDIGISQGTSTSSFGIEALKESAQNRKDFREAVMKAVQDYKEETSMEVTTEAHFTSEYTETGTIQNPNDELACTCLFYELQKRYRVSEQLFRVTPVVLVAQEVPSPDKITPAWAITHDWILNRVLLDDSFRPTLSYLANNSVGEDYALRELRKNLRQQRSLVETLKLEFAAASQEADNKYLSLLQKIDQRIDGENQQSKEGAFEKVVEFFGGDNTPNPDVAKARELAASDQHKYAVERAEKISVSLQQEVRTLHALTESYNKTLQARLDNETRVKRLLVHIRKNIFYYMQAIWNMEPPDQRFLRLHKVGVPVLKSTNRLYRVTIQPEEDDIFARFRADTTKKHTAYLHGGLELEKDDDGAFVTKSLVEVADLHKLLGCMGNYLIFPLKEHNALTECMAAPYVDQAFGAMDPDEMSNVTLDQFSQYVCCLHDQLSEADFDKIRGMLKKWLDKLLAMPLRNGDEIVVPTGSLFIKMLVDNHPVLEDFKLKHRELDVFKVQEDVRRGGLENLRLASRLLHSEREDPDIEKKIVVASTVTPNLDVDNP